MVDHESPAYDFSAVLAKHLRLWFSVAVVVALLLPVGNAARGDEGGNGKEAVRLLKVIPVPGSATNVTNGKLYSFDISFVDQSTKTYYLADRSNAVIDVVDPKTAKFVKQISAGFTGVAVVGGVVQSGQSGPNGVVAAFPWLFVTDAHSRVVSIDLRTDTVADHVKTGATTDVLGVGAGDEVWFNEGNGNYYATGSGSPFRPIDVVGSPRWGSPPRVPPRSG